MQTGAPSVSTTQLSLPHAPHRIAVPQSVKPPVHSPLPMHWPPEQTSPGPHASPAMSQPQRRRPYWSFGKQTLLAQSPFLRQISPVWRFRAAASARLTPTRASAPPSAALSRERRDEPASERAS